ncbi:hypothetical protein H9P43_009920 [Blastocladiella emersonii ATCC 22665]|nr:hypothetical protein H9P43_009920 [Blastocladiella emersonii ATCC 22665]
MNTHNEHSQPTATLSIPRLPASDRATRLATHARLLDLVMRDTLLALLQSTTTDSPAVHAAAQRLASLSTELIAYHPALDDLRLAVPHLLRRKLLLDLASAYFGRWRVPGWRCRRHYERKCTANAVCAALGEPVAGKRGAGLYPTIAAFIALAEEQCAHEEPGKSLSAVWWHNLVALKAHAVAEAVVCDHHPLAVAVATAFPTTELAGPSAPTPLSMSVTTLSSSTAPHHRPATDPFGSRAIVARMSSSARTEYLRSVHRERSRLLSLDPRTDVPAPLDARVPAGMQSGARAGTRKKLRMRYPVSALDAMVEEFITVCHGAIPAPEYG